MGLFFNTIPRAIRADQAYSLRDLFAAARCRVNGSSTAEQDKELVKFIDA